MFFLVSKVLSFAVSPLTWVFALWVYSFVTRIETRRKRARIAGIIVLYLFGNPFLVDECFRAWEPVTPDHDLLPTHYDGAIVLGGLGDIDLRLGKITFGMSGDRLFQALPLYYNGRVSRIIFTGGSGSVEFPQKKEGLYVRKYLRSIRFPDSALVVESESRNTYENAVYTRRTLDSLGLKGHFLLVTSAYHMPRSMAVFRKAGFANITPYITNRHSGPRRFTPDHLLVPTAGSIAAMETLIHEWLGYLIYKVKGYA